VELIIPPNINDPLNLLSPVDKTEYEMQLTCNASLKKKRQRKRFKSGSDFHAMNTRKKVAFAAKPVTTSSTSPTKLPATTAASATAVAVTAEGVEAAAYDSNVSKESSDDEQADPSWEIIEKSAAVPSAKVSPSQQSRKASTSGDDAKTSVSETIVKAPEEQESADQDVFEEPAKAEGIKEPSTSLKVLPKVARCQYGNYNRYFGFESLNKNMDVRLKIFQRNVHLFRSKDVLDVGCNVGLMTIAIAKFFNPKSIVGVDIDKKLVGIARGKLKKYVSVPDRYMDIDLTNEPATTTVKRQRTECFPMSFPMCYGNLGAAFKQIQKKVHTPQTLPSTPQTPQNEVQNLRIPDNVSFEEMDYVPKDEIALFRDAGKYDLVLCLSVTKWIHLNYGDNGMRLTFRKIFNQLRPGGKLILELQNWPSYKKKKKMTEAIYENYKNIKFSPSSFADYLLSQEVGFSHFYTLGVTQHLSKGFKRPIYLFVKGDFTPKQAAKWSDVYFPSTTPYQPRRQVYTHMIEHQYAPLPAWLSPMPSPYTYSRPSHTPAYGGTPNRTPYHSNSYYNPQQSDYLPSYDNDLPRHQFAFMSPSSHSSSPSSSSKRSIDEDQQSPSATRHHLYHLITDPPKSSTDTNSND